MVLVCDCAMRHLTQMNNHISCVCVCVLSCYQKAVLGELSSAAVVLCVWRDGGGGAHSD